MTFTELGKFPGGATYIAIREGDTIYSITGTLLEVWDARKGNIPDKEYVHFPGTNEIVPKIVNKVEFDVTIGGIAIQGNRLFLGHGKGITILDKTNLTAIGSYTGYHIGRMKIDENTLVATTNDYYLYPDPQKLLKFDISGSDPVLTGTWDKPANRDGNLYRFDIHKGYAYFGFGYNTLDSSIYVVRLSDMQLVKTVPLQERNGTTSVVIDHTRNILYTITYVTAFYSYDISNPENPVLLNRLADRTLSSSAITLTDDGNTLLASVFYYGVMHIDVSNPSAMRETKLLSGSSRFGYVADISYSYPYILVGNMGGGFSIFNYNTGETVHQVVTHGIFYDVRIAGNYMYVTADFEFLIIDISDRAHPKYLSSLEWARSGIGAVIGNRVYIDEGWRPLGIFDVSDPTNPTLIKQYSDHTKVGFVDSNRKEIVIGQNPASPPNARVQVLDYDANLKREISVSSTFTYPPIVQPVGNYLYASIQAEGVKILSDNGSTISNVGEFKPSERFTRMVINGNIMYGLGDYYLHVYNVSNPLNPVKITEIRHPSLHFGGVYGIGRMDIWMDIFGQKLYNGAREGLVSWDISNPAAPGNAVLEIPIGDTGGFDMVGSLTSLAVSDKGTYLYSSEIVPVSTGKIECVTDPAGAAITLDNKQLTLTTPSILNDVLVGTHQIKFTKTGYQDTTVNVTVVKDKTVTAYAKLSPIVKYGEILAWTIPFGARITLDNKLLAYSTPFIIKNVPVGTHQIKFTKTGYQDATVNVTVAENQRAEASARLSPIVKYGEILAWTIPFWARITLDNKLLAYPTPLIIQNVEVGTHQIKFSLKGYQEATVKVTVVENQRVEAYAKLSPCIAGSSQCVQNTSTNSTGNNTLINVGVTGGVLLYLAILIGKRTTVA